MTRQSLDHKETRCENEPSVEVDSHVFRLGIVKLPSPFGIFDS